MAKWHPSQGFTPRQRMQFLEEVRRTDPKYYEYVQTLGSGEMAWAKYKGASGNPGYTNWKNKIHSEAALQVAKGNTRPGQKVHVAGEKSSSIVRAFGSNDLASAEDWAKYREGKLELYTEPGGVSRFVSPEQYETLREKDLPETTKVKKAAKARTPTLLEDRYGEVLGIEERPKPFSAAEIDALPEKGSGQGSYYSGTGKPKTEAGSLGRKYYDAQAKHNQYIKRVADGLDDKGYFTDDAGGNMMSGKKDPYSGKEMTAREYWESNRRLNYGHRGAATNAGFGSVVSWIGNANPEFEYYNKLEGATLTPQEAINIDTSNSMMGRDGQMMWTTDNRNRYNNIMAETDELVKAHGLEIPKSVASGKTAAGTFLGGLDDLPLDDDPLRGQIHSLLSDPNVKAGSVKAAPYTLLGNANQLTLAGGQPGQTLARLGLLNQVEGFQTDAWLQNRGDIGLRRLVGDTDTDKIKTALAQQEGEQKWLRRVSEAMDQIRSGGKAVNVDDLMGMASKIGRTGGKFALGLAPMIALMTNAEAAEAYDKLTVDQGEEIWSAVGQKLGIKDAWTNAKNRMNQGLEQAVSGEFGPQNQIGALGATIAGGLVHAAATEWPGAIKTIWESTSSGPKEEIKTDMPTWYPGMHEPNPEVIRRPQSPGTLSNRWTNE